MYEILAAFGFSDMDYFEALNPLYAFPMLAVIVCMFIVYTFGFKSVQPPSFERIEEDVKVTKKRKTKDISKKDQGKNSQNGKLNVSKNKSSGKKKEEKIIERTLVQKPVNEKKPSKKKASENKSVPEIKKSISNEDISEDGWVQLVSKKARKNRKDDVTFNENITANVNHMSDVKSDTYNNLKEKMSHGESPETKKSISNKDSVFSEKQVTQETNASQAINISENQENSVNQTQFDAEKSVENVSKENPLKNNKVEEKCSSKSKKKKKSTDEKVQSSIEYENMSEHVNSIAEFISHSTCIESPATIKFDSVLLSNDKIEDSSTKEARSSNVVFDEMEGLYPQAKEQKKKKKVRRDH